MHLHILGISGTFMSGLALIARQAGFYVTGSDLDCYPPVSDLLQAEGIPVTQGYEECAQALNADCILVGNAMKRGMPVVEAMMDAKKYYTSGPQWLADTILSKKRVLAVAGTHGKTTTTSMLAYILHYAGLKPSFLIGGLSSDFQTSACLNDGEWFVIEADEYDTAFFDKRPKFMHYRPEIAILNNLEFDHADIYPNLAAIQRQFHYFLKTIPGNGVVIKPQDDQALNEVLQQGQFCQIESFASDRDASWKAELLEESTSAFRIWHQNKPVAEVHWPLIGRFNVENGLAAFIASIRAGVQPSTAAKALEQFTPVKRRLEVRYNCHGITVYDDFAHHPTAIGKTLEALRQSQRHERIIVVIEFASFTMRSGFHVHEIAQAFTEVDLALILKPQEFSLVEVSEHWRFPYQILSTHLDMVEAAVNQAKAGDGIVIMSNRGFGNIHQLIINALDEKFSQVTL